MNVLRRIVDSAGADHALRFYCPGCDSSHAVRVGQGAGPRWTWNGSMTAPTFSPSVLVTYNGPDAGQTDEDGFRAPSAICHSFVTDGCIKFLGDCTHALAGQTVDIPAWNDR